MCFSAGLEQLVSLPLGDGMDPIKTLQRIRSHSLAGQLAPDVLIGASRCEDEAEFLTEVLSEIVGAAQADFAAVSCPERGVWKVLSASRAAKGHRSDAAGGRA